jgi:hypothetical protein
MDDTLWVLNRQARAVREAVAEASSVWNDTNARTAEQRFLQPRAEAEATMLASVAAQHQNLEEATARIRQAEEQQRLALSYSSEAANECASAARSAQAATNESAAATGQALQADQQATMARNLISQANDVGAKY